MTVRVTCPNPECGAVANVEEQSLGHRGRCKKCGHVFALARPDGEAASAMSGDASAWKGSSSERPAASPTNLPEQFGRYRIMKQLGQGGMGAVYLAHDIKLNRQVALKVPYFSPSDGPEAVQRFEREARAAATLDHPNLCPIHDVGENDGIHYLTMPYIEGKPLSEAMTRGQTVTEPQAAAVARKLALALQEAHEKGIIHRDLKPGNIMVNRRRELIIMDFGLARVVDVDDRPITRTGNVLGTALYMAPEQAAGDIAAIGPASDVYSLGVILYELLTGVRPFEGPWSLVIGLKNVKDPDPPSKHRPALSPALNAISLKAIARDPEDRYATMAEFAKALGTFLAVPAPTASASDAFLPVKSPESLAAQVFAGIITDEVASLQDEKPPAQPKAARSEGTPPRSRSRGKIIAAGAAAVLLLGVIIYVVTDKGRIKIDVNDPDAVVLIDGQQVRIEGLGDPITLRTGEHELSVKRGALEAEARKFVVRRGDNLPLIVEVEAPPPIKAIPADPMPPAVTKVDPPPSPRPADAPKTEFSSVDIPKPREPSPKSDDSLITNSLGMKLKLIPAGEFAMGSNATDPDARDDEKVNGEKHQVRITRPFYIGTTEVTVGQFRQFVDKTNYRTEAELDGKGSRGWNEAIGSYDYDLKHTWRSPGFKQEEDHPVVIVSWNDAVAFCEWLSQQDVKTCRLPTEAEWEYSCRSGQTTRYSSGDDPELLATVGNVIDGSFKEKYPAAPHGIAAQDGYVFTSPVGRFHPNKFGLFDMQGNAWEWCADWYASDYYSKSPLADPLNSSPAADRIRRGGCWDSLPRNCRTTIRYKAPPGYRDSGLGFRVARDAGELPPAEMASPEKGPEPLARQVSANPPVAKKEDSKKKASRKEAERQDGWVSLFNGRDLSGWKTHQKQPGNNWRVVNGVLVGSGPTISHLYTERDDFTDFHLRIVARFNKGGRSGLFFRCPFGPRLPADDPKWPDGYGALINRISTGGLYPGAGDAVFITKFAKATPVPFDQWFTLDVIAEGNILATLVNGQTSGYKIAPKNELYPRGHIVLQQYTPETVIEFRKIEIKELNRSAEKDPKEIGRFPGHRGRVSRVAFSTDGLGIVSDGTPVGFSRRIGGGAYFGGGNFSLRLLEASTGRDLSIMEGQGISATVLALSSDGRHVASSESLVSQHPILIWDLNTKKRTHKLLRKDSIEKRCINISFSPDDRRIMAALTNGAVLVWDLATEQEQPPITLNAGPIKQNEFHCAAFSSDRKRLVTGSRIGAVEVWELEGGKKLHAFAGHVEEVFRVACSADGRLILSCGIDNTLRLWDVATGRFKLLRGEERQVLCIAFSPDRRRALSAGVDGPVRLWDLTSGKEVCHMDGHTMAVNSVAFSPDGHRAVSGSDDRTVRLWQLPE